MADPLKPKKEETEEDGEDSKSTVVFNLNALKEELKSESANLDSFELKFNDFEEVTGETEAPKEKVEEKKEEVVTKAPEATEIDAIFDKTMGGAELTRTKTESSIDESTLLPAAEGETFDLSLDEEKPAVSAGKRWVCWQKCGP